VSLRAQLLAGLAVLVLAAVSSTGWLVLRVARGRLDAAEDERARVTVDQIARLLRLSYDGARPQGDDAARAALAARAHALVERGDARDLVVVDMHGAPLVGDPRSDGAIAAAAGGAPIVRHDGAELVVYASLGAGPAAALRARLGGDAALGAALASARRLLVGITLFDGGLVLLFGALFLRRVIGPLEALAGAARRVAAGEVDVPPVPSSGPDEVGRLTSDFNRMTASLRAQRDHLVAQEKLATVGRLAAGVAHEIGNPLAAILGYVEMLLADESAASPERRDMLARIRRETERIRAIVADLLEYSRPPSGAPEPVALAEVADAALSLLRPQARFRDVTVDARVPRDLPLAAGSSARLVQVLVNLLLNAADAMNGAGTITLTARPGADADAATVELRVTDTGPGVPAADRARIFDPFFTTKEPGRGTGLGLAISRSIVEVYGGSLTLAPSPSDDQPGATFVLKLPLTPSRDTSAE
jgi:two-component system, NtrC family, sensor kinase